MSRTLKKLSRLTATSHDDAAAELFSPQLEQMILLKADCNPERFATEMIFVLNVLLIIDSLRLHKICILKKTSSKEE